MSTEKGKFSAEIDQSVIEEALSSVRKRSGEPPVPGEAQAVAPTPSDEGVAVDDAPEPQPKNAEVESLKAQLELSQSKGRELMEKLREEHERTLRATADLENYRKRALKERDEIQRFGLEKMLKDFLPVADNFDRALDHAQKSTDLASLQKGVEMVKKLFEDALGRHGVRPFSAVGKPFDPRLHEAMGQVETRDQPPNTVVFELSRGYMLNDRLVRPAMVSVARPPAEPAEAPAAPAAEPAAADAPASAASSPNTSSESPS